ncbi:MAG: type II toxin-antitoxin system VapC family toxin [Verrucomicrobia bacterium]|nr:type II toxin-antitoxin system VapC family toxin [Verrucomicrobiota bacterium]
METVYLETTIISYLIAKPSRDLIVAAHQQITREWWHIRRPLFACCISQVVLDEAALGDKEQARQRLTTLANLHKLPATEAAEKLAATLVEDGALPAVAARDAAHLAIAAAAGTSYLLTWNCRHLANAQILKKAEEVCKKEGFTIPFVCTPEELMGGDAL